MKKATKSKFVSFVKNDVELGKDFLSKVRGGRGYCHCTGGHIGVGNF